MRARALAFAAVVACSSLVAAQESHVIQTIAGGGPDQLPKLEANLEPSVLRLDGAGNLYVLTWNRVYKIGSDGIVRVLAGNGIGGYSGDGGPAVSAQIYATGLAVDAVGNVFIAQASGGRIRRVDAASGIITHYAGNGDPNTSSGDGGPATVAALDMPCGMAVDAAGNLFFTEHSFNSSRVRRIDASTGIVTTVAGNGTFGFGGDFGPATAASLAAPVDVAVGADGSLLIADTYNQRVRRVDSSGTITTVAGNGGWAPTEDGGLATETAIGEVSRVALDSAGRLLFFSMTARVRRVDATGIISTVAGSGVWGYGGDGGPATEAMISGHAIALDGADNLYIGDSFNARVRHVDAATGIITTFAGSGARDYSGDGYPGWQGAIGSPRSVALTPAGDLYNTSVQNWIRRLDAATAFLGTAIGNGEPGDSGDGGPATEAQIGNVNGIASDQSGNVYFADTGNNRIRRIDAVSGIVTTVAGNGVWGFSGDGGPASNAKLRAPQDMAVDAAGNLYIADTVNHRVRRVNSVTGVITTIAGTGSTSFSGDFGPATAAGLGSPATVAVDSQGGVLVLANGRVRRIGTDGIINTVAGNGTSTFIEDGAPATSGGLGAWSFTVTPAGRLLLATNGRIRLIDADGNLRTLAGDGTQDFAGDGGPAALARFRVPSGIAVASDGAIYVADQQNDRLRRIANAMPVANAGGPYEASRNQAVEFDAIASSDADADPLHYRWDFGDGATGTGMTPTHVYADYGSYTVTVFVDDGLVTTSTTTTVDVVNHAPTADAGPDQTVELGSGSVVLSGSGSDPDNDTLSYEWRDQGGAVVATTASLSVSLGLGSYDYTLTVSDGFGGSASDSVHVVVQDTTAPAVTVTAPSATALTVGFATTITWSASDNGVLSGFDVLFSSNGGGSYSPVTGCSGLAGSATSCAWASPGPASANARIRVVGRDASDNDGIGESAFTIADPAITVTSPNTNVSWTVGSLVTLAWTHNLGAGTNVKIELSRDGGGAWTALVASTPNTGSYPWTVTGPSTTNALVRLSWTTTPTVNDTSDVSFTIANQSPTVNAGPDQTVELGSGSVLLSGSGSDPDGHPISYEWRDQGGVVVATTASFSVSLGLGAYDYTLTVSDGFGGSANDSVHVVVQDTTAPVVTVTAPSGGAITVGVATTIKWTAADNGLLAGFDVLYSTNGGGSYSAVPGCSGLSGSATSCAWASPGPASADARIRVVGRDASNNNGVAESAFTIANPSISVTSPNTAVNWAVGSQRTLTWNHNLAPGQNVKIEISRNGGSTWTTIIASTPNTGSYNWSVTGGTTIAARIRVSWTATPTVNDASDVNFTIATGLITVTVPNTAVTWGIGTQQTLTWTHNLGPSSNVKLEVSRNAGNNYSLILASLPNSGETSGSYVWTVTGPATVQARIKVTWTGNLAVHDRSDVNFIIQ